MSLRVLLCGLRRRALCKLWLGIMFGMSALMVGAQERARPAVQLPAAFREMPANAQTVPLPWWKALEESALEGWLVAARRHQPARAALEARIRALNQGFSSRAAEQRVLLTEIERLDAANQRDVIEVVLEIRSLEARRGLAERQRELAAEALDLVRQRLNAGLASAADLHQASGGAVRAEAMVARLARERMAAEGRLGGLTGAAQLQVPVPALSRMLMLLPVPAATPADLLVRADVRAAAERRAGRDVSAGELDAGYRETLLRAVDEAEAAYAALRLAHKQQTLAEARVALAVRQLMTVRMQLEAGRAARGAMIEADLQTVDAQSQLQEAALLSLRALAQLHLALGQR